MGSDILKRIMKFYSIFLYSIIVILGFVLTSPFLSPFKIMSYVYWVTFIGISFAIFFKSSHEHRIFKKLLMAWGLGAFLAILVAFIIIPLISLIF